MTARRALIAGAVLLAVASGCTGAVSPITPLTPTESSAAPEPSGPTESAIGALLARVNATAGGPVGEQRALLAELVDPGQVQAQEQCGDATTTLSFEPLLERVRLRPEWRPPSGSIDGTVWGVPVLMRIHSGDRLTGTDLTELHVVLATDGTARLPAMCIN